MGISKAATKLLRYVYISVGILAIEILAVKGSSMRTYLYHQDQDNPHQGYARRGYSSSSIVKQQHDVVDIEEFVLLDVVGLPHMVTSSDLKSLEETFLYVYNNQQKHASVVTELDAKELGAKQRRRRGGGGSTTSIIRTTLDFAVIIPDAIDPKTNPHTTATSSQEIVYSTDDDGGSTTTMISMVNVTYLMIIRGKWDHACASKKGNDFQLFGGGTTTNSKNNPNSRILFDQVTDGTGNGDPSSFGGDFVSSRDNDGIMQKFRSIQNNNNNATIHDDDQQQYHDDRDIRRSFLVGRNGNGDDYKKSSLGRDCDGGLSNVEDFTIEFNRFFNTMVSNETYSGNVAGLVGVQQVTTF